MTTGPDGKTRPGISRRKEKKEMQKNKFRLKWFDDTYTVTVYKDAGITTATASPASGAKNTEVTLTITPASNKMIDEIEVVTGGVTVNPETKKFTIGEADVVLYVKSKSSKSYMVTENTFTCVNGVKLQLTRNMMIRQSATGAIIGVDCEGTEITLNDAIQNLIDSGVIVPI